METTTRVVAFEDESFIRVVQIEHQQMPIDIESPPESHQKYAIVSRANRKGKEIEGVQNAIAKIINHQT